MLRESCIGATGGREQLFFQLSHPGSERKTQSRRFPARSHCLNRWRFFLKSQLGAIERFPEGFPWESRRVHI